MAEQHNVPRVTTALHKPKEVIAIQLSHYAYGAEAIRTASNHGVVVAKAGGRIEIRKTTGDPQSAEIATKALKLHKDQVKSIVDRPEGVKQTLCEARTLLLDACLMAEHLIDQMDGLMKAYQLVHPDDKGCIYGDNPCTDEDIVKCVMCAGG